MTSRSLALGLLAGTILLPGCTHLRPSSEISRQVIESLTLKNQPTSPWRLGLAWIPGDHGGAALRPASVEHVVRQKDPIHFHVVLGQSQDLTPGIRPNSLDDETDRAWRKFCRHQLNMTESERQIVRDTPIPDWLLGQCYSGSLLK